jgi:predicted solute-binding protein
LSGDSALDHLSRPAPEGLETHNITDMWGQVTPHPLVLGLWVYTSKELEATFAKWLITSRNLGLQNLSRLADGIAATVHYESGQLYDYFANSWSYNLDKDGMAALCVLEELAVEYDLVREGRLAGLAPGLAPVKVPAV